MLCLQEQREDLVDSSRLNVIWATCQMNTWLILSCDLSTQEKRPFNLSLNCFGMVTSGSMMRKAHFYCCLVQDILVDASTEHMTAGYKSLPNHRQLYFLFYTPLSRSKPSQDSAFYFKLILITGITCWRKFHSSVVIISYRQFQLIRGEMS